MDTCTRIALVDDHTLFRRGLMNLCYELDRNYEISWEAGSGVECLVNLEEKMVPDILLMDVSMPEMDGYTLATEVRKKYPELPILVISMIDKEEALVRMLRLGIRGYLSKDIEPEELRNAIESILNKGYYYTDHITGKLIIAIQGNGALPGEQQVPVLTDRERTFLELACSDDTYKEIADKMCVSVKTVDSYRMNLFEKLQVRSRTGMVLYAVKNGIAQV